MERLKAWTLAHQRVLKSAFILLVVVLISFILYKEIRQTDFAQLQQILTQTSTKDKSLFVFLALFAFSFVALYDVVLRPYFQLKVSWLEVFRIGWIAQSFNNFIGFGGASGATLRIKLYDGSVEKPVRIKLSMSVLISNFLGLFVLALPAMLGLKELQEGKYMVLFVLLFLLVLLFLFGDRLPIKFFQTEKTPFAYLNLGMRSRLLLVSVGEWFAAALFFAYTLHFFDASISWTVGVLVFVVAVILGTLSMVPGGLGTFDATCLVLLKNLGHGQEAIIIALLIYRLTYTLLPWVIGLILMFVEFVRGKASLGGFLNKGALLRQGIGIWVIITSLSLLTSAAILEVPDIYAYWTQSFPTPLLWSGKWLTTVSGFMLFILGPGLMRGMRNAYRLYFVLLPFGIIGALANGMDIGNALTLLIIAGIVRWTHNLYHRENVLTHAPQILRHFLWTVVAFGLYFTIYNYMAYVHFLSDHSRYALPYLQSHALIVFPVILLTAYVTHFLIYGLRQTPVLPPVSAEDYARFQGLLNRYEGNVYTHLFHLGDKTLFFNQAGTVVFQYAVSGKNLIVLGNPIGEPRDFEMAIDELLVWANSQHLLVSFYEIDDTHIASFISEGFQFIKLGEVAVVDLTTFTLSGKKNRGFRNTRNQMEEAGYRFAIHEPPFSEDFLDELRIISDEWLAGRGEMGFSLGSFQPQYLQTAPIFVLHQADGAAKAFATMLPVANSKLFSIDLMRYSEDTPGAMDMLFISLLTWAQEQNYSAFELGNAPFANTGTKLYSNYKERVLNLMYRFGNEIYGFKGLRAYKNKYRPSWHNVYLAYSRDQHLLSITYALIRLVYQGNSHIAVDADWEEDGFPDLTVRSSAREPLT